MMKVMGAKAALKVTLSDSEADQLAVLAQQGDMQARDTLAHSFTGLALSIAGAYARSKNGSRWAVDEVELRGMALETLLRYGIDNYRAGNGLSMRMWVALVIRRKLAMAVEHAQREVEGRERYATEREVETQTELEGDASAEVRRVLTWARKSGLLTRQQIDVLELRGYGLEFKAVGAHLGIHRKQAGREYAAALKALEGRI